VPLSIRVAKVNVPDALIGRSAPPPFCNTRPEPESPVTVPPTVYVAGGGGGAGPESPPPHAVSAARTAAAKPHRVMLRIRDFILIPSLVINANGGAHCAMAATVTSTARKCTPTRVPLGSTVSSVATWLFVARRPIPCMNVSRRFRPDCRKIPGREWLDSAGVRARR
jgi:hypothetical protein